MAQTTVSPASRAHRKARSDSPGTVQRFYVVMQDRAGVWVNSCDEIDNVKGAAQMCKALNMDAEADESPHYMVELRPTGRIVRVGFD